MKKLNKVAVLFAAALAAPIAAFAQLANDRQLAQCHRRHRLEERHQRTVLA
jgi:hypothetical protein